MANNTPPEILSNDYILPLLGLGRPSFGPQGNFIACRLTTSNQIVVEVMDRSLVAWQALKDHVAYETDVEHPITGTVFIIYKASVWQADIEKFKAGKYSQFSEEAKKRIRTFAGNYDVYGKFCKYGPEKLVLHALEKTQAARDYWERTLGQPLPPDAECWSIPNEHNFVTL